MPKAMFTPPDSKVWVFLAASGQPIRSGDNPVSATLPMAEIAKILSLVSYVNSSLASCRAVQATAP